MNKPLHIIIAGEGGQGVQSIARALVMAAYYDKKQALYIPNYGVEQRGGVSLAFIQICLCKEDSKYCHCSIGFPKFDKADILVVLCERAVGRVDRYVTKDTIYSFDKTLVHPSVLSHLKCKKIAIPATYYAKKDLSPRVFNTVILGGLLEETKIVKKESVERALKEIFKDKIKKDPEIFKLNQRALGLGIKLTKEALRK